MILSVEGLYGALLAANTATPGRVHEALTTGRFVVPRDVHVTYYTAESLHELLAEAGLEPALVTGCHYVPEGPLDAVVDVTRLDDEAHRLEILALESACADDPVLRPLARAWLAVGKRP